MDTPAKIKKALQEVLGINPNLAITATVVSVEQETCTIKLLSELVISDVRLKATITGSDDGLMIIPRIGSEVIVMSQTGKLSGLMVIKVDSIDTIKYKNGDFEFTVDGTTKKVTIKNAGASVGNLIGLFIDQVSNAVIDTPNGPGSINAATKAQLTNIKTQFKSILND